MCDSLAHLLKISNIFVEILQTFLLLFVKVCVTITYVKVSGTYLYFTPNPSTVPTKGCSLTIKKFYTKTVRQYAKNTYQSTSTLKTPLE
jgi:hypothetical protein